MNDIIDDLTVLDYDTWVAVFEPVKENGFLKLYDVDGDDFDLIQSVSSLHVWTWVSDGLDISVIMSSFTTQDSIQGDMEVMGYYLTKTPYASNKFYYCEYP